MDDWHNTLSLTTAVSGVSVLILIKPFIQDAAEFCSAWTKAARAAGLHALLLSC